MKLRFSKLIKVNLQSNHNWVSHKTSRLWLWTSNQFISPIRLLSSRKYSTFSRLIKTSWVTTCRAKSNLRLSHISHTNHQLSSHNHTINSLNAATIRVTWVCHWNSQQDSNSQFRCNNSNKCLKSRKVQHLEAEKLKVQRHISHPIQQWILLPSRAHSNRSFSSKIVSISSLKRHKLNNRLWLSRIRRATKFSSKRLTNHSNSRFSKTSRLWISNCCQVLIKLQRQLPFKPSELHLSSRCKLFKTTNSSKIHNRTSSSSSFNSSNNSNCSSKCKRTNSSSCSRF